METLCHLVAVQRLATMLLMLCWCVVLLMFAIKTRAVDPTAALTNSDRRLPAMSLGKTSVVSIVSGISPGR